MPPRTANILAFRLLFNCSVLSDEANIIARWLHLDDLVTKSSRLLHLKRNQ